LRLAIAAATGLFLAGCSGVNTSQSVSPMMFLVPGLGQAAPTGTPAASTTNSNPTPTLALAR